MRLIDLGVMRRQFKFIIGTTRNFGCVTLQRHTLCSMKSHLRALKPFVSRKDLRGSPDLSMKFLNGRLWNIYFFYDTLVSVPWTFPSLFCYTSQLSSFRTISDAIKIMILPNSCLLNSPSIQSSTLLLSCVITSSASLTLRTTINDTARYTVLAHIASNISMASLLRQ